MISWIFFVPQRSDWKPGCCFKILLFKESLSFSCQVKRCFMFLKDSCSGVEAKKRCCCAPVEPESAGKCLCCFREIWPQRLKSTVESDGREQLLLSSSDLTSATGRENLIVCYPKGGRQNAAFASDWTLPAISQNFFLTRNHDKQSGRKDYHLEPC